MTNLTKYFFFIPVLFFYVFLTNPVYAAVGDIGIWRDSTGDSIPSSPNSYVTATFETEDRNDGIYTKNGSSDSFTINETGRYLVMYLLRGSITHNNRADFKARVKVNSTVVEGTYGEDFVRNNANADFFVRGYGILDVTSGDVVKIEWEREVGAGTPTGSLTSSISELMLVRMPDSTNLSYAHYTDNLDNSDDGGTSWNAVPWNTTEYESDTSVVEKQSGNSLIRLKKIAKYLVIYSVSYTQKSGGRAQRVSQATLNGSSLPYSASYTYMRDTSNEYGVLGAMFIVDNTLANQDLEIQVQRGNSSADSTIERQINESGLFIMELPSSAETFISYDSVGGQNVAGSNSNTTINYARDVLQSDSNSFTASDSATIKVNQTADYLFMSNVKISRSSTSSTRLTRASRWELNGSDLTRGRHGTYLRGNQGNNDTYDGAFNPSMVIGLSANDLMQLEVFDSGDDGNSPNDTTQANEVGVCALNLDTLTTQAAVSITLDTDGVVAFGSVAENTTSDTTASGIDDTETILIDSGPVDLDIKSTEFSDGSNTWSLGGTNGTDTIKWEFSSNGTTWTTFGVADTLYSLATGVETSSTQDFYLRLTTPTSTSSNSQYSTTLTIVASEP